MSAGAAYWDTYFARKRATGEDLDWRGRWTQPFLAALSEAGARTVLELGCGTGNDAARLARAGYAVTAVDLSRNAIDLARARYGDVADFGVVDVTDGLPFAGGAFDAVMANVALHMFRWDATREVFADVERVLRPGGVFVFHVNAREDRPLRARRRPVERELAPNYVLEKAGQAVRFFSREDLRGLLVGYESADLQLVEIEDEQSGEPFKIVWRGVARRPGELGEASARGTPAR
jgi:SAM-dependent methyltransferase